MNPLGLYEPGTGPLHRAAAGPKLVGVMVVVTLAVVLGEPAALAVLCAVVAVGYAVAWVPPRRVWRLLRTALPLLALIFAVQALLLGPLPATTATLRLAVAIGVATLFTLTTRVDAVVTAVERGLRPLRRFGVRPERVGLLVGLTVAAVGTLAGIAAEVRAAARARGAERSVVAFAAPFLVRTLRHADRLGEALTARGWGDEPDEPGVSAARRG
ncbi:energy-coupling factor transporter transmembrane component T family protein [Pseudonocardia lacus]|uniref:energy-coupling factor transporter transmembrane component T family protein n=1 Tax=Pseudonocardia lacus TaxID=2835865 RepID=UPI001BDDA52C|nr:CbiQ family ECF transporter T component [Pseudonocardia lacus]